jgi:hypothetical protein
VGDLVFNGDNYDLSNKNSDFNLFILISEIQNPEEIMLLGTTINNNGKMALVEINESNMRDVLGEDIRILIGRYEKRIYP